MSRERTHWDGCWRAHSECATAKAEEALEQLENASYWLDVAWGEQLEVLDRLDAVRQAVHRAVAKFGTEP